MKKHNYKIDDIVTITDNLYGHGFAIGQRVRITGVSPDGTSWDQYSYTAKSTVNDDLMNWSIGNRELKLKTTIKLWNYV